MTFIDVLKLLIENNGNPSRESVEDLARRMGYRLVHDEGGKYEWTDPVSGEYQHGDGYHIYASPDGECWKVDFADDSYSSGYLSSYPYQVEKKTVTKELWVRA